MQRIGPPAAAQAPPSGLVMSKLMSASGRGVTHPTPSNVIAFCVYATCARPAGSPSFDWTVMPPPATVHTVPFSAKTMRVLRRTASVRASCRPLRNESAVVRTYELCIQVLNPGVASPSRIEITTSDSDSSIRLIPPCAGRTGRAVGER